VLLSRARAALPEVFTRVPAMLLQEDLSDADREAALADLRAAAVDAWEPAEQLARRREATDLCVQQGARALASNDTAALREAVRKGTEELKAPQAVAELRKELTHKNLLMFRMKSCAKRLHENASLSAATNKLRSAMSSPVRLDELEAAVDQAKAAGADEKCLSDAMELHSRCAVVKCGLEGALSASSLTGLASYLDEACTLGLQDDAVGAAEDGVAALASSVRPALESRDLVELDRLFSGWQVPPEPSDLVPASSELSGGLAEVAEAARVRARLRALFDRGQAAFSGEDWAQLQEVVQELRGARVDAEAWGSWTSALQREQKAREEAAEAEARLRAAMRAESIQLDELREAAEAASGRCADRDLVAKARQQVESVEQRLQQVEAAIRQKCVDKADVFLFKLQSGRVRVSAAEGQQGPLWDMVARVRRADAAQDGDAMEKAMEGWYEDNPGNDHPAFAREDSPTRLLRLARSRAKALQAQRLVAELDAATDSLTELARAPPEDIREGAGRVLAAMRALSALGCAAGPGQRAALLAALHGLRARGPPVVARFAAAMCGPAGADSPEVVLLIDQSRPLKRLFDKELKPAVAMLAGELQVRLRSPQWGAVAYGPVQRLRPGMSPDFEGLLGALAKHECGKGKVAAHAAFREAAELFAAPGAPEAGHGQGPPRVVLHVICGEPEDVAGAEEAFRRLEAQSVTVVGLGVGAAIARASLERISSRGLAFMISDFAKLKAFVEASFASLDAVLEATSSASEQDIMQQLENL